MDFMEPKIKTFRAGADLSAKQFHFVKFGTDDDSVIPCSAADEKTVGILMNAPDFASGELCEVAMPGGGAKIKASAVIARGAYVAATATGQGKTSAPTSGNHSHVGAIAQKTSATNDVIEVIVVAFDLFAA